MTWRLLLLAVPLSLLLGCDPEQTDGALAGLEGLLAGGVTVTQGTVLGGVMATLFGLVKVARKATAAARTAEQVAAGPSRSAEKVAEHDHVLAALRAELAAERAARLAAERRLEHLELLLLARGIGTLSAEPAPTLAGAST